MKRRAKVYLVGAGPGDPDLISVKGLDILKRADVILHDRLAPSELLKHARDDAEIVDAGKTPGSVQMNQSQINDAMISAAQSGRSVCRLKGGDPFVFGRGGEEAIALHCAGVSFEVIPGITSAISAPAYSGIPVTHRGVSRSCTIVTGSTETASFDAEYWRQLAQVDGTLVVLMATTNISHITEALIKHGRPHDQAAAATSSGTRADQATVIGTLGTIAELTSQSGITPPVVFTFGEVVSLSEEIDWITKLPLYGKRAVVSRARSSNSRLSEGLRALGAVAIETPAIRIEPLTAFDELDATLSNIGTYEWLAFASSNAVAHVFKRLDAMRLDARYLHGVKVAAIGPATVEALKIRGITADLIPEDYSSDGLITAFANLGESPKRVLAFKSDIGRESVMQRLTELGAKVDMVSAYRTVAAEESADHAKAAYREGVNITTFTSSSTVNNLVKMLDTDIDAINSGLVACIGPITAETARKHGINVDIVPRQHTIDGMLDAIQDRFADG